MNRIPQTDNWLNELLKSSRCIKHFYALIILSQSVFYLVPNFLHAQEQRNADTIDISKIQFSTLLDGHALFEASDTTIADDSIPFLPFAQKVLPGFLQHLQPKVVGKNIYLRFAACNSSDSIAQAYFFPGFYFTNIKVYKSSNSPSKKKRLVEIKKQLDDNISSSFALLTLQPKESADFFLNLSPLKSRISMLSPQIINKNFISYFKSNLSNKPIKMATYLVCGILLMMIFYSLALYLQDFKTEFLYYSAYAFFTGLLLFLKSYLHNYNIFVNFYFEGFSDFILQSAGFLFYIAFIRKILQAAKEQPFMEKVFRISQWITIVLLIVFSFSYFLINSFIIPYLIENVTKLMLITLSVLFIIYGSSKKDKLINYLIAGQSMLILFSFISFVITITTMHILKNEISVLNEPMLYYEIGVVSELAFFFTALAYKNKKDITERAKESERLKSDNERKELEKQIAVMEAKNDERNRISADMHDELGSGVTAIRLMSEIVKTKMKGVALQEIEKISSSANDLLEKMNTIIWTMISSNDSAESLVTYIRAYAVEFFESTLIRCHVNMPAHIPETEISGEKRRNVFLSVKEALNNVLKHSHAANVSIAISIDKDLVIEICDDGKGIDMENLRRFGNGISNMKKRIESIGGELCIQNNNGTMLVFTLKL